MHSIVVSETKINLSFTEGTGVSNRLYKLLAAKGFVLTMPFDTMHQDFTPGKDFDIFNTPSELKQKIKYYLKNENEREIIALHGYKTVQKYDHVNYAKFILKKINES
jgi:spore maturation protein CgeB